MAMTPVEYKFERHEHKRKKKEDQPALDVNPKRKQVEDLISAAANAIKVAIESEKEVQLGGNASEGETVRLGALTVSSLVANIEVETSGPGKEVEKHHLKISLSGKPMDSPTVEWSYPGNGQGMHSKKANVSTEASKMEGSTSSQAEGKEKHKDAPNAHLEDMK
ncbi:uncharacterized protein LOC123397746 isoform X1 [Hordeum vulgare subsp. vulgare]|uniref:uncharacterized protein LOC123397746 isoform X1 n=1 Tax=Hordeum vulgare subsp. vulgare TaxID=112509 RepID=UPI001D1A5AC6|nr:uncharacterized protein LOC123397746 isoform X1 [Hordeum vulgare subsp. vulgare]